MIAKTRRRATREDMGRPRIPVEVTSNSTLWAHNFAKMRDRKKWSQQETADRIGVSRSAVANWERGINIPRLDEWPAIAEVFGVDQRAFLRPSE